MYCILWYIVRPPIVFDVVLCKLLPLRLILTLCNSTGPFNNFGKVMLLLLYIYNKQNPYLMNCLLLVDQSLCFVAFMVSSKLGNQPRIYGRASVI